MDKIGVACVGYGLMGKVHSMAVDLQKNLYTDGDIAYLQALVTRDPSKVNVNLAKKIYSTIDEAISDKYVKLIDIDSPNHIHFEQSKKVILSEKPIYLEKPLSNNIQEAKLLSEMVKDTKIINQVALVYRFIPAIVIAKQQFEANEIGDLINFSVQLLHSSNLDSKKAITWRNKADLSGAGAIMDLGIHCTDVIRFVIGEVLEVLSTGKVLYESRSDEKCDSDDLSLAMLKMRNNALGTMNLSKISYTSKPEFVLEMFGTKGSIYLDSNNFNQVIKADYNTKTTSIISDLNLGEYGKYLKTIMPKFDLGKNINPHITSMKSVIEAVRNGEMANQVPSFHEAYLSQLIVEACIKSIKSNQWEKVG